MSEQQLTKAIIDAVNASLLAFVWRSQAGKVKVRGGYMQLAPDGCPDVIGWMLRGPKRGVFLGIEVKLPGEKPSAAQNAWYRVMTENGCIPITVWSVQDAVHSVEAWSA